MRALNCNSLKFIWEGGGAIKVNSVLGKQNQFRIYATRVQTNKTMEERERKV